MRLANYFLFGFFLMAVNAVQASEVIRFFKLSVDPFHQQAFDDVGLENLSQSVSTEAGTLSMYLTKDKANPSNHFVVEIYQNNEAYNEHTQSEQFTKFLDVAKYAITNREVIEVNPEFVAEQSNAINSVNDANVLINLVEVVVDINKVKQYRDIVLPEMKLTLENEPHVQVMYAVTYKEEPNRWLFFEIYANDEAYQYHRNPSYFLDYLKQTEKLVIDKSFIQLQAGVLMNKGGLRIPRQVN